jgi:hypothetical protein
MTEKKTASTDYILVRHSRKEMRVSIEKSENFDLTNYTFLGMSVSSVQPMEEWVWTEDAALYRRFDGATTK